MPISALTAANVTKRFDGAPWYSGPCFLEVLDLLPACDRNHNSALRLPILSKYKDLGTVVEGKVIPVRPPAPPGWQPIRKPAPSLG